jgi:xylulokinase
MLQGGLFMLLMGLDVGTTGAKACVFSPEGKLLGYGFEEYSISCPAPGVARQNAEEVFATVKRVMKQACAQSGGDIAAIGLSVQGDAVMPVDNAFKPLAPVQLGMDYSCKEDADAFEQAFGARALFSRTGMRPHPLNSLCKVRNFARNMRRDAEMARYYVTYADFILSRLGADEPLIDMTMASRTMGMDICTLAWDEELLAFAGIGKDKLSRPVPSGTVGGRLKPALAEELGINKNPFLVTGGHDQACAALGAGIVRPDMALDSHGTAEVISTAFAGRRLSDAMYSGYFPCYAHTVPNMFFTFSLNHTAGILLKWFVENFCQGDVAPAKAAGERLYEYVLKQAADEPSRLITLPYFNGKGTPDWDLNAKGMISGLTLASTRHDIARSIVEALCYDMKENISALRDADVKIDSLRSVGGGARSPIGLQLKADVTEIPVHTLVVREAACLGAAMLAGIAMHIYTDAVDAAKIVHFSDTYEPRPVKSVIYREKYELYRKLFSINRSLLQEM